MIAFHLHFSPDYHDYQVYPNTQCISNFPSNRQIRQLTIGNVVIFKENLINLLLLILLIGPNKKTGAMEIKYKKESDVCHVAPRQLAAQVTIIGNSL